MWTACSSLSYLGIRLTYPSRTLLKGNYDGLQEKLLCLSKELSHFPVSWAGRIAQSKMYRLLHILYMFCRIPLPFLPTQLKILQLIINTFIWQHKKPGFKKDTLLTPVQRGGTPKVQAYYRAVVIDQIREWWLPTSNKTWTQIESTALKVNLKHILMATLHNFKPQHQYLNSVAAALRVWSASSHWTKGLPRSILSRLLINVIELLSPDLPLKTWTQKGLNNLGQLVSTSGIHPFSHLQQTFDIPTMTFFLYL